MPLIQRISRLARILRTRPVHRLRRLSLLANHYAKSHGGWFRSIIKGGAKSLRVLALEGPKGLLERLARYSQSAMSLPVPAPRRLENYQTLRRIPDLDIYGTTGNLERVARSARGNPPCCRQANRSRDCP